MGKDKLAEVIVENEIIYRLVENGCYCPKPSLDRKRIMLSENAYGWYLE